MLDRKGADRIFYVLRTGCQWKALAQTNLCAGSTAHNRFQEWLKAGVFLKCWQTGVERFDELRGIDFIIDGTERRRQRPQAAEQQQAA